MKTVVQYLDDLKEKYGSDYRSAKLLNIKSSAISNIRSRGQMSDDTAIKMADLLGIDRNEVIIAATIARSEGEVKKTWENISKLSGVAAGIIIASALTLVNSSAVDELTLTPINYQKCILCQIVTIYSPRCFF